MVKFLAPVDLQNLYEALGIPKRKVLKAEASASTSDVDLKAKEVLRQWKQKKGKLATRKTILDALQKCENLEAKEQLEEEWTRKGNKQNFASDSRIPYVLPCNFRVRIRVGVTTRLGLGLGLAL